MGIADRYFEAPPADAAKVDARMAKLPVPVQQALARASRALEAGDTVAAGSALAGALAAAPTAPDVLRLDGARLAQAGDGAAADARFEAALQAAPDDAVTFWQYARACEDRDEMAAAFDLRRRAIEQAPQSPLAWADLGEHLFAHASAAAAILPLERSVELAPQFGPALLKLGQAYAARGRAEDGARCFRSALAADPEFVPAWAALVDLKTIPTSAAELEQMRALLQPSSRLLPGERIALEYTLAQACEAHGLRSEAWQHAQHANGLRRRELPPWERARFAQQEQQAHAAFVAPHAQASDPELGRGVIFIVGMLRSGTTLVEQILASHRDVAGGGELRALPEVLTDASRARQLRYPEWVGAATPGDWDRLGERYLELTAKLRVTHAVSTDKLPGNWQALGAIRAMLPGAHIVVCRRDPLENCWSCFKQYFLKGSTYANDLDDLAAYWHAFDRAARTWCARAPQHVRAQSYEALTADPEAQIRALLDFCGLPFDAQCLRPQELQRSVHTLSAAQVRQPIHASAHTAAAYGALLDPLRHALGLAAASGQAPDAPQASSSSSSGTSVV